MGDVPQTRLGGFAFLTRRTVLKLGAAGVGALAVAGVGGALGIRGCAPPVTGLRILSRYHYRTLAAIGDTLIPRGGAIPQGASDFDLARAFDGYLADEPAETVRAIQRALHLVEYGPVVFDRRFVTFSNLTAEERAAHWRTWETSDQLVRRQVALAFRKYFFMMFYDQPDVWPHIGYPGPALTIT
ncbi:MAG: hypothetical protein HUU46_06165 [Candidatus Hydrogenedentes bacterium]|nr:hypothetical protein [Candidatus Hydrogenedentota bacterium]